MCWYHYNQFIQVELKHLYLFGDLLQLRWVNNNFYLSIYKDIWTLCLQYQIWIFLHRLKF